MALPYFTDRARESSSSTGTGAFTLGGAFPGYQTFADGGAEGQTVDYAIEAVDADGNPTGQWETGKGAYSAGVLTRTTPEDGSEALPVDFAAGSKNVFITVTAATFDMLLAEPLTAPRFTLQTSVPSAASTGEAKLAIRDIAGFGLAQIRSESGHCLLFPSATDPLFRGSWITTGVTRDYKNMPAAISSGGTATGATVGGIAFRNLATAATTNSVATDYVNSQTLVTSGGVVNGYLLIIPFRLPDASYGSGATGSDIFVGCINGSVSSTDRLSTTARGAGFSYSTPLGDTNWQFTVRDGGTTNITTTDTGMAFAAQKHYLAMIYGPASGSDTYWCLVNLTDGTVANGSTARKHGSTAAQEIAVLYTRDNVARNLQCNDFWTLMGGGGVTY